jgi:hypothetical protein
MPPFGGPDRHDVNCVRSASHPVELCGCRDRGVARGRANRIPTTPRALILDPHRTYDRRCHGRIVLETSRFGQMGMPVEITRRQLFGAGIGLVGSGLLDRHKKTQPAFSLRQTAVGRRVRSGRIVTAQYTKNVSGGSLLVAVVSRLSTRTLAQTVGQISDDQGNHWLQAVEYFTASHYGVDVWYCESARGGSRPTVTGVCLGYPVRPGTDGMRMMLLEYSGARGFELCDQICQANVTGTTATTTTNFDLESNDELAISVVVGDMTSATVPSGWNSRVADVTQRCYVADTLSSGASAGAPLSAAWTGLTGASAGAAVVATFVPRGVSSGSRRLVQSSYTDSAILPAGRGHARWRSQPYPVDPIPGNTLVAFMNGSIYHPRIDCGSVIAVTDSAGGQWHKVGESGPDDHTGINISCWICQAAPGGRTSLTATFSNASQQLACLLLEFANLPEHLQVRSVTRRSFGADDPHLVSGTPVSAGDVAFAFRTSIFVLPQGPGSPEWRQMMSDTTGANALVMLDTPAGELTAEWSGRDVKNGLDMLLVSLSGDSAGGHPSG